MTFYRISLVLSRGHVTNMLTKTLLSDRRACMCLGPGARPGVQQQAAGGNALLMLPVNKLLAFRILAAMSVADSISHRLSVQRCRGCAAALNLHGQLGMVSFLYKAEVEEISCFEPYAQRNQMAQMAHTSHQSLIHALHGSLLQVAGRNKAPITRLILPPHLAPGHTRPKAWWGKRKNLGRFNWELAST